MGRPKKRKLDGDADADGGNNESNDDDVPSQHFSNEQEDDGNWFNGGGFGSPMVTVPVEDHDYWPSLEEAHAAQDKQNQDMMSLRRAPSLIAR